MSVGNDFLVKLRKIQVVKNSMSRTIKDLLSEFQSTKIRIPDYQRSFVWEYDKQRRFIESIFLQVPIPPIFFLERYEELDGEEGMIYEVIDGVQRLTTLANFESGKLTLAGLERLPDLNQAKLSQLPASVKDFFLARQIDVICIQSGTNPEVQFEVFGRLNQGAVALNAQELRNCMFHGEFNNFLMECSRNLTYRELLGSFPKFNKPGDGKPDKNRMQDVEMVLRFFTLHDFYNPEQNKYPEARTEILNAYMRGQIQKKGLEQEYLEGLENLFVGALEVVKDVFYPDHFKSFLRKPEKAYFTTSLNQSIADIQMLGFLGYERDLILKYKDVVRETFIDLCCYDRDFIDSISRSTNTKVTERVSIWRQQLVSIFESPEPYQAKLALKKKLFSDNRPCVTSGEKITSLDNCDIYNGQLYLRSELEGNDIFKPREKQERKNKNSKVNLCIAGELYTADDIRDAVVITLDFIRGGIQDQDFEYHVQRIMQLPYCGNPAKLSKLQNKEGLPRSFIPVERDQNLYFDIVGRSETLQRLSEISSLFGFMQPFSAA